MTPQEMVGRNMRVRAKKKVITAICKFVDVGEFKLDEEKDVLSQFCWEILPRTTRGFRLGFTFVDNMKVPLFSRILDNPGKNLVALEIAYEVAEEVYSLENMSNIVHAVIFESNSQYFVFSRIGAIDDNSVMILRWRNQTRFIYPLHDFLIAMGATGIQRA